MIEPSTEIIPGFTSRVNVERADRLEIFEGNCEEISNKLEKEASKNIIIIINTAFHHMIRLEEILDRLKSIMNVGDLFVSGHEPNNA